MKNLNMILACDRRWGIGENGKLLVHLPGDLKYFKEKTLGGIVIMGRKTADSLPGGKPLPNRFHIMLSATETEREGFIVLHSIDELSSYIEELPCTGSTDVNGTDIDQGKLWVIGGGQIYRQLLPHAHRVFVTKIDEEYDADTYFENLDENDEFRLVNESEPITENGIKYTFCEYERISGGEK